MLHPPKEGLYGGASSYDESGAGGFGLRDDEMQVFSTTDPRAREFKL